MAHLFCHSCGTKLSYAHAKPNFCGKCGQQLNASASTNTSAGMPTLEKSVELSADETDASYVPQIQSFQIEVEHDQSNSMTSENRRVNKSRSINEFLDEKKKER
jgi:hypothetical protein